MAEKKMTVLQLWGMPPVESNVWTGSAKRISTVNDGLIAGLELEIENLPLGQDAYIDIAGRFWSVVEDGSLRPRGAAWEFVSRPATLSVMLGELAVLISKLRLTPANYTDRCSVHVHTNVQDFTQDQLAGLSLVYPVFEEVLFQYVNHYKKLEEQGYCRDTNLYCIPWSSCRMNRRFINNLFSSPDTPVANWQKYTALNLRPIREHGTVEWRHMHGTCDMEKLTTWVNIIGAIMKYAKETPLENIIKTIKVMNDVSTYKAFFEEVLLGTLPYEEQYRALLREGILNAKYSLINFDPNAKPAAKKVSKSRTSELLRTFAEAHDDNEEDDVEVTFHPPQPAGHAEVRAVNTARAFQFNTPPQQPGAPGVEFNWEAWDGQNVGGGLAQAARQFRAAPIAPDNPMNTAAEQIRQAQFLRVQRDAEAIARMPPARRPARNPR